MLKASPPHIGQHRPAARGAGKRVRVSLRTLTLASPSQAAERSPPERADRPLQGDVGVEGVMRPCRSRWQRCARCPGTMALLACRGGMPSPAPLSLPLPRAFFGAPGHRLVPGIIHPMSISFQGSFLSGWPER